VETFIFFGFPALVTMPIAVLFCRDQIARRKIVSIWLILPSALIATLIDLVCALGPDIFTRNFWNFIWDNTYFPPIAFFLFGVGIPFAICLASAALIIGCYRCKNKKTNPTANQ
jgi:hypothetical protein